MATVRLINGKYYPCINCKYYDSCKVPWRKGHRNIRSSLYLPSTRFNARKRPGDSPIRPNVFECDLFESK